jgi:ribonucleoside-triphosphate reductase
MNNIRLYSTHCPKCRVVEKKLEQAQIQYDLIDAKENPKVIEELTALGVQQMPVLIVDDKILGFSEIIKWIGAR